MIVKNNLNSGITLADKKGNMVALKASGTTTINEEQLTDEFNRLETLGYISLIREVVEEEKVANSTGSADESDTVTEPTTPTKKTNKGGKK